MRILTVKKLAQKKTVICPWSEKKATIKTNQYLVSISVLASSSSSSSPSSFSGARRETKRRQNRRQCRENRGAKKCREIGDVRDMILARVRPKESKEGDNEYTMISNES